MTTLQKVKIVTDGPRWYVIPNDLFDQFQEDEQNEEMFYSGLFDLKYGKYRTGGDLNLIQLYAEI